MTQAPAAPPPSCIPLVLAALTGQGDYGVVTQLAREHEVTRQRVYRLRDRGQAALEAEFFPVESYGLALQVTEADIERTIVSLRVVTPASLRDIEDVLPEIFGVHWSYGHIQQVVVQAEERARAWLSGLDLSAIDHVALDEMFSQGAPVLGGIDLDSGLLFALEGSPTRSGAEWGELLGALRHDQNLHPDVVVKDAGSGLASGVQRAWPGIEERDDLFHAVYELGKVATLLENKAYQTMQRIETLREDRGRARKEKKRRSLGQQIRLAEAALVRRIDRYDRFEVLRREAGQWLQLTERGQGRLREPAAVTSALQRIAQQMKAIGTERIEKVATYLYNRSQGLTLYLSSLKTRLDAVSEDVGGEAVVDAVVRFWQARLEVEQGGPFWDRRARQTELDQASQHLVEQVWPDVPRLNKAIQAVLPVLEERHRASSAIENLNSVLRPYLVVQKGVNQGFLDLFRFYWNTRKRRWGRHKGTSAVEVLQGQEHEHWLTLLGYPPSEQMRAAA